MCHTCVMCVLVYGVGINGIKHIYRLKIYDVTNLNLGIVNLNLGKVNYKNKNMFNNERHHQHRNE